MISSEGTDSAMNPQNQPSPDVQARLRSGVVGMLQVRTEELWGTEQGYRIGLRCFGKSVVRDLRGH